MVNPKAISGINIILITIMICITNRKTTIKIIFSKYLSILRDEKHDINPKIIASKPAVCEKIGYSKLVMLLPNKFSKGIIKKIISIPKRIS